MSLKGKGAITGVGDTRYSKASGKSVTALQMEASLAAIRDAGPRPQGHRRHHRLRQHGRGRRGLHHQLRHSRPQVLGRHAARRRQRGRQHPMRGRGHRSRRLQSRADPARPQRLVGRRRAHRHPRPRDAAVPRRRRVRDAVGRHRAGAALRADGAPSHGALRHHQPAARPRSPSRRATTPSSTATR